jgi:arsenite-transporting ATPase
MIDQARTRNGLFALVLLTILSLHQPFVGGFQLPRQPLIVSTFVPSLRNNILRVANTRQAQPQAHARRPRQHSPQPQWNTRHLISTRHSALFSLTPLVEEVYAADKKQTIFVGGKGGVGKTTVASALAVELASRGDLKVLVVSTDPAHSLGDALDVDLRSAQGNPVTLTDPVTGGRLDASEVNAAVALQDFRDSLASFDIDRLATSMGVSPAILEGLGLREFSGLLNNPPPGLDELVALGNVMDSEKEYDVVVVDTAPTGHTLRLLALPQFLNGLLGKLVKLRVKLSGLTSTLQAFLGDTGAKERAQTMDTAMDRLETFQTKITNLEQRLKDDSLTSFLVVTIPTKLAVAESKRLVTELTSQGIAVKNIVINQCVGDNVQGRMLFLWNCFPCALVVSFVYYKIL